MIFQFGLMSILMYVQFVETDLGSLVGSKMVSSLEGFIPMEMVIKGKLLNIFSVLTEMINLF